MPGRNSLLIALLPGRSPVETLDSNGAKYSAWKLNPSLEARFAQSASGPDRGVGGPGSSGLGTPTANPGLISCWLAPGTVLSTVMVLPPAAVWTGCCACVVFSGATASNKTTVGQSLDNLFTFLFHGHFLLVPGTPG